MNRSGGLRSVAGAIYEGCIVQRDAEGPVPLYLRGIQLRAARHRRVFRTRPVSRARKVSIDVHCSGDIAFPPQILVRWLSGRKRRFAKALYLKRVPRVRIPPSPVCLSAFPLYSRGLREEPLLCRRRSLAKLNEPKRSKDRVSLTRND
jgi:hypothetical protein